MRNQRLWSSLFLASLVVLAIGLHLATSDEGRLLPSRSRARALTAETPAVAAPSEVAPGSRFAVAAAGDIAGEGNVQAVTATLLTGLIARDEIKAVLALGDTQYPGGEYHDFLAHYAPSWGVPAIRSITRPVPGNHDYDLGRSDADGYFDYFNGVGANQGIAGERYKGWYSFDMGDWHFIALNTSDGCRKISCAAGSPMHTWLLADLAATEKKCVLAYFHHPRFVRGDVHEDDERVAPLWDALYDAHADVVLAGHEHTYQQLAPLDKNGQRDEARGLRSFVVGTGGADLYGNPDDSHPGVVEWNAVDAFGILVLVLEPQVYSWRFVALTAGEPQVTAQGRDACR